MNLEPGDAEPMADEGPDESIDALVRDHLAQLAGGIDTRALADRILQGTKFPSLTDSPPNNTLASASEGALYPSGLDPSLVPSAKKILLGSPLGRTWRRLGWALLTAAAALLAFLGGLQLGPTQASAADLLREAQKVHLLPVDRCYLVEVRYGAGWNQDEGVPPPPPDRVTRLWTRGDQFWMESLHTHQRWSWGRDERGGIWLAFGQRRGIRIDKDELPRWLETASDVQSMQLETLLNEVLAHFDIRREPPGPGQDPNCYFIHAKPRLLPWLRGLRSVTLEVDTETKVLRKVTIARVNNGQPLATTTYTLIETEMQPESKFQLEGHLTEPYEVFTRDHRPERRAEILSRVYGPLAGKWFQLQQKGRK